MSCKCVLVIYYGSTLLKTVLSTPKLLTFSSSSKIRALQEAIHWSTIKIDVISNYEDSSVSGYFSNSSQSYILEHIQKSRRGN